MSIKASTRANPEPLDAPDELWGVSDEQGQFQVYSWPDSLIVLPTKDQAAEYARDLTSFRKSGTLKPALIGISPAVREQRDRAVAVCRELDKIDCCDGYSLTDADYPTFWRALNMARLALSEIEGGGRVGTPTTEEREPR